MFSLLLEEIWYPEWMTASFPVIRIVLMVLLALLAVSIIVIVMMMESNPDGGTNVISGQSDSFYSKNQSSSKEGRLKKAIVICSIALVVIAIAFWVLWAIMPAN